MKSKMSRSRKKNVICGNTSKDSEKEDKKRANRKFRKKVKRKIKEQVEGKEIDEDLPNKVQEVSDNWCFEKDGKQYIGKDSKWYDKIRRK